MHNVTAGRCHRGTADLEQMGKKMFLESLPVADLMPLVVIEQRIVLSYYCRKEALVESSFKQNDRLCVDCF